VPRKRRRLKAPRELRAEAVSVVAVAAEVEVVVVAAEAALQQLRRLRHLDGPTDGSC
jgi:hypothetical protein